MSTAEPPNYSQAESLASLPGSDRTKLLKPLTDAEAHEVQYDWAFWRRPDQIPPKGDWTGWLIIAGRFWGKTRVGAEFVRDEIESGRAKRVALVGETSADGQDVMVKGESGILACCPPWNMPRFISSGSGGRPKLVWPNGAIATLYDAREPEQLRGPQHDLVWFDELAKYRYADAVFEQAMMGLRLGEHARFIVTTTPRPIKLIIGLMKRVDIKLTRGKSDANLHNVARNVKANVIDRLRGTRLGRQELDAEILEDIPGALWNRRGLDEYRVRVSDVPAITRLVVAIDPAVTSGDSSNETGIIVAGIDEKRHAYVLEDATMRGSPDQWARMAVAMYRKYEADMIVAECNQGGDLVERVIRSVSPDVPVTLVRATRGKYVRAEPISALYEQGRVSHVGTLPELEDQMIAFTPEMAADRTAGESPDRVDALVWGMTNLFDTMALPQRHEVDEETRRYSKGIPFDAGRDDQTGY